jgi:hypothetical protein
MKAAHSKSGPNVVYTMHVYKNVGKYVKNINQTFQ